MPVVIAWGARHLTPCLEHLRRLPDTIDVLTIRGHTEGQMAEVLQVELAKVDPDCPVMIAPDDLVVSAAAIEAIVDEYAHVPGVYCGWSNVDLTHTTTNVMLNAPHKPEPSSAADYELMHVHDIATRTEPFRVGFNGFTLLTMPARMWLDEATRLRPCGGHPGFASDWSLCYHLAQNGIPITCVPAAFAAHLKVNYMATDTQDAWKRLDWSVQSVEWRT